MAPVFLSILALLGSVGLFTLGSGLLGTLLGVRMTLDGFDPQVTGLVMAAFFFGLMIGAMQAGRVIHRAGHIRAFAVFAACATAAVLLQGLFVSVGVWALLRVITGFSAAGIYMVIESWLNERASAANRGRVFSIYQVVTYLGLGAGQFLLFVGDPATTELFMITAGLFALSLIPVAMTRGIHPSPPERHGMALRPALTESPLGVVACVGAGMVNGAVFALTPVFALEAGLGLAGVSLLMGAIIFGGFLLQWPIGHLSDSFGRRGVMAIVNLSVAVVAVALIFSAELTLPVLMGIGALFGGLSFTLYPLAVAHANDQLQVRDFVTISAALLFLWGLGSAVGPVLAGQVMGLVGNIGLFLFVAVIAVAVALTAWAIRRETVAPEEQEPFVVMARTTPVASELDPRYDDEAAQEAAAQQARADAETIAAELWDELVAGEAEATANQPGVDPASTAAGPREGAAPPGEPPAEGDTPPRRD